MSIRHVLTFGEQSAEGLYYRLPVETGRRLESALTEQLRVEGRDLERHRWFVLANLALLGDRVLPKSHGPVVSGGGRIAFPFLDPELLGLGLALPEHVKNACGEAKLPLKQRLAELLPREWVYRPKSGFKPPLKNLLPHPEVAALVEDVVLQPGNALLDYCDRETVARLYHRIRAGQPTSKAVLESLWKLVFVSCWWRHQRELATGPGLGRVVVQDLQATAGDPS
jgi:asparagine synthetase B (glutamine-hydrolysing)